MGINKPFHRVCRPHLNGSYSNSGGLDYIKHNNYAQSASHYVRAFLLIQKDLGNLLEYIEPCETNSNCYSFRTHELLTRTCIEVEANCKVILAENGYTPMKKNKIRRPEDWNMKNDYWKIQRSHKLARYSVEVPFWKGDKRIRHPYQAWKDDTYQTLDWYKAYNNAKHDRHANFDQATFNHLLDAICGLLVIISAQFYSIDFSNGPDTFCFGGNHETIGGYFAVKFPNADDWPEKERYNFKAEELKNENYIFAKYNYNK